MSAAFSPLVHHLYIHIDTTTCCPAWFGSAAKLSSHGISVSSSWTHVSSPPTSACRCGSGRPPWISHSLQSAQPGLLMSIKIVWLLLRFKDKLCVVLLLLFSEMQSSVICQISACLCDVINRSAPSELKGCSFFKKRKALLRQDHNTGWRWGSQIHVTQQKILGNEIKLFKFPCTFLLSLLGLSQKGKLLSNFAQTEKW